MNNSNQPIISAELESEIRDGGFQAIQILLWAALDKGDMKMVSFLTNMLNVSRDCANGSCE